MYAKRRKPGRGLLFFCMLILIFCLSYFGSKWFVEKRQEKNELKKRQELIQEREQEMAERNLPDEKEAVLSLQEEIWHGLSEAKRVDVLQRIILLEQKRLGLLVPVKLQVEDLEEDLMAYYMNATYEIRINRDLLLSDATGGIVNAICHEMYHSFQHWLIEISNNSDKEEKLAVFDKALQYENEFGDYESGDDDFDSYYAQKCEKDARKYGEKGVKRYSRRLGKYLGEK